MATPLLKGVNVNSCPSIWSSQKATCLLSQKVATWSMNPVLFLHDVHKNSIKGCTPPLFPYRGLFPWELYSADAVIFDFDESDSCEFPNIMK